MIKIECDICKKDVDGVIPENYFKLVPLGRYRVTEIDYEFCIKCYRKICEYIRKIVK